MSIIGCFYPCPRQLNFLWSNPPAPSVHALITTTSFLGTWDLKLGILASPHLSVRVNPSPFFGRASPSGPLPPTVGRVAPPVDSICVVRVEQIKKPFHLELFLSNNIFIFFGDPMKFIISGGSNGFYYY